MIPTEVGLQILKHSIMFRTSGTSLLYADIVRQFRFPSTFLLLRIQFLLKSSNFFLSGILTFSNLPFPDRLIRFLDHVQLGSKSRSMINRCKTKWTTKGRLKKFFYLIMVSWQEWYYKYCANMVGIRIAFNCCSFIWIQTKTACASS